MLPKRVSADKADFSAVGNTPANDHSNVIALDASHGLTISVSTPRPFTSTRIYQAIHWPQRALVSNARSEPIAYDQAAADRAPRLLGVKAGTRVATAGTFQHQV